MSTLRLFFALWPDQAMQAALSAAVRGALSVVAAGSGPATERDVPARTGTGRVPDRRGGRAVPIENLHVTLAFLGAVPESSLHVLGVVARDLAGRGKPLEAPLDVTLDTIDYWRRAQILCAAASREPAGARALADRLKSALSDAGFRPDLKPFRAHVTLARHVRRAPSEATMAAVTWTFDRFALIESRAGPDGPAYSVVDSWILCGAAAEVRSAPVP